MHAGLQWDAGARHPAPFTLPPCPPCTLRAVQPGGVHAVFPSDVSHTPKHLPFTMYLSH